VNAKTIFWLLVGVLMVLCVMFLGMAFNIANPLNWFSYIFVATVALIAGYVFGRKVNKS